MDFTQQKLSKSEWESIEVPETEGEIEVLKLITKGFNNVNIRENKSNSIFTLLKIEYSEQIESYLFNKYLAPTITGLVEKYGASFLTVSIVAKIVIKTADRIRIDKTDVEKMVSSKVYEFLLLDHVEKILKYRQKKNKKWIFHYFTLYKLSKNQILLLNRHVVAIVEKVIEQFSDEVDLGHIIEYSDEYIEKNQHLLQNADMMLYEHQKELFTISKNPEPKLVLYIAPTGTGKTLSPLGLSETHRVIFVCAARHVGLALARAAVSIHKKVAFAFGCSGTENIRLHYFAAKDYTRNFRTGGIFKVDNTVGDKVEIMICDIRSYISAMLYMLAFNPKEKIITYWDEPTITMDYDNHEFHEIIKRNWNENLIPNMVLSSATLPKMHELTETISDFQDKFPGSNVYNIVSHDCRKSIPLVNRNGYVEMPHYMSPNYDEILEIAQHCENYLTLLRYFDLKETAKFITYIETTTYISPSIKINRNFGSIDDIDMKSIKLHYIKVLKNIIRGTWGSVYLNMKSSRVKKIVPNDKIDESGQKIKKTQSIGPGIVSTNKLGGSALTRLSSEQLPSPNQESGNCAIYVTTKDAYTLTDGPTIFIVSNVDKISRFCIQQANIPACVMDDIMEKMTFNNTINEKITELEQEIDTMTESKDTSQQQQHNGIKVDVRGKTKTKAIGVNDTGDKNNKLKELTNNLNALRSMIKIVSLNETFVPNKLRHLNKWTDDAPITNAFTSDIDEATVVSIMMLKNVEDSWKILLLLGIGVFTVHRNVAYTEIMKTLANKQQLYMIIATSDYIYGTNYQFCHGYLSKDLSLTQEKIIQALGRIGRNNIQQDYSIRFRDDEKIKQLFTVEVHKPEVINMNRLFNSKVNF